MIRTFDGLRIELDDITLRAEKDNDGHWNLRVSENGEKRLRIGIKESWGTDFVFYRDMITWAKP